MDRPPADAAKLLDAWMDWERGDTPPGRTMATLKTGGLRDLLEEWVAKGFGIPSGAGAGGTGEGAAEGAVGDAADQPAAGGGDAAASWTPVV